MIRTEYNQPPVPKPTEIMLIMNKCMEYLPPFHIKIFASGEPSEPVVSGEPSHEPSLGQLVAS